MSYWLKANERATIVGQYATEGAGGTTNAVYLPGKMQFNYTASTILDNKTNQPAFQAVGVEPDVRVPVTEETERSKLEGGDPVLDAGIAASAAAGLRAARPAAGAVCRRARSRPWSRQAGR